MSDQTMFVCTDVSPYADGPAGVHGVLGQASTALCELGSMFGLEAQTTSDARDLDPVALARGGVLGLFTIGDTRFNSAQKSAIAEAWAAGRLKILAVHSAIDAGHSWDTYGSMIGARFDGHPWTQTFTIDVTGGDHPATAHLPEQWSFHDEVYLFRDLSPKAQILLQANGSDLDMSAKGARRPECGFPLAWTIEEGPARSFTTALGHFPMAWENVTYLRHLHGGLSWLLS